MWCIALFFFFRTRFNMFVILFENTSGETAILYSSKWPIELQYIPTGTALPTYYLFAVKCVCVCVYIYYTFLHHTYSIIHYNLTVDDKMSNWGETKCKSYCDRVCFHRILTQYRYTVATLYYVAIARQFFFSKFTSRDIDNILKKKYMFSTFQTTIFLVIGHKCVKLSLCVYLY